MLVFRNFSSFIFFVVIFLRFVVLSYSQCNTLILLRCFVILLLTQNNALSKSQTMNSTKLFGLTSVDLIRDYHQQLPFLSHSISTVINHDEYRIFNAFVIVLARLSIVLPSVYELYDMLFFHL